LHYYAVEKIEKYKAELKRKNIAITEDSPIFLSYGNSYDIVNGQTIQVQKKGGRLESFTAIFRNASMRHGKRKRTKNLARKILGIFSNQH
jgi:hypothetical protein